MRTIELARTAAFGADLALELAIQAIHLNAAFRMIADVYVVPMHHHTNC